VDASVGFGRRGGFRFENVLTRHFYIYVFFGLLFFAFFYLFFGSERFQTLTFYAWLWVASLVVLLGILRVQPKLEKGVGAPDFDENITVQGAVLAGAYVMVTLAVAMAVGRLVSAGVFEVVAVIYAPLAVQLPEAAFNTVLNLVWQVFVVGWSEEILCYLLFLIGVALMSVAASTRRSPMLVEAGAVAFSRGFWTLMHGLKNPAYIAQPLMMLPAFIGGVLFYLLLKQTGSLPLAASAHGVLNWLVYLLGPA
jgi:membrane protease YdiL (CAAX protease family)